LYFQDRFAVGNDGYFYVLQAKYMIEKGRPLYPDPSALYPLLAVAGRLAGGDLVVGCKYAGMAAAFICTLFFSITLIKNRVDPFAAIAAGAFFALSRAHLFLDFEFLKNAWGLAFYSAFLASLCSFPDGRANDGSLRRRRAIAVYASAATAFLLCFAFHKLSALLSALTLALWLFFRSPAKRRLLVASIALACLALFTAALALGIGIGPFRREDLGRIGSLLSISGPLDRIKGILAAAVPWREKAEYLFLQATPALLVALALLRRKGKSKDRSFLLAMASVAAFLVFPLFPWSFDGAAFRLLLAAWMPAAFLVAESLDTLIASYPKGRILALLTAFALALPIAMDARALHANGRNPDFASMDEAFANLASLVPPGDRLVAGRGIAPFAWFKSGIPSETFSPPRNLVDRYRIVYGISPLAFEAYLAKGENPALGLGESFTLVPETLWRRLFDSRSPRSVFLKDPINPWEERPSFAIACDESLLDPAYREGATPSDAR
jgi:hypothetical protein